MKLNDFNNDNPIIYIMVGLPGSGKSTWIKEKMGKTPLSFVVISSDDHIEKMASELDISYTEFFNKYIKSGKLKGRQTPFQLAQNDFKSAVKRNDNIIWDQTNLSRKKRRGILNRVPSHYKKVAVNFSCANDELERRLENRRKETGKYIPPSVLEDMCKAFQGPTKDEGFDEIINVK